MHLFLLNLASPKDHLTLSDTLPFHILHLRLWIVIYTVAGWRIVPPICLICIYCDLKVDMVEAEGMGTIMTMVSCEREKKTVVMSVMCCLAQSVLVL